MRKTIIILLAMTCSILLTSCDTPRYCIEQSQPKEIVYKTGSVISLEQKVTQEEGHPVIGALV